MVHDVGCGGEANEEDETEVEELHFEEVDAE